MNVHQAVEVYTQGTKAWFEDDREAWVSTTCVSNTIQGENIRIVFQSDNDERVCICTHTHSHTTYTHFNVILNNLHILNK